MNPHAQHRNKDAHGLLFVHQFGWLRTAELGKLLWPSSPASRQAADRLARSWIRRHLVIVRELPEGAGRALVLATAGVRLLAEHNAESQTGKDIGRLTDQGWLPPASWRHDLIAHGVLCELHKLGYRIYPEVELRRRAGRLAKIPDGFAVKGHEGIWLEVEQARKTGPEMRNLVTALEDVSSDRAGDVLGYPANAVMVAFVPSALDERGHVLSHQARVRNAIHKVANEDVSLCWAACSLLGVAGIGKIEINKEKIPSKKADRILEYLYRAGWHRDENGRHTVRARGYIVHVWHDEHHNARYVVKSDNSVTIEDGYSNSIDEARRAAVFALARVGFFVC